MNQVQKDLAQAAELIKKHGWMKHRTGNIAEGLCLMGALCEVFTGNPYSAITEGSDSEKERFSRCITALEITANRRSVLQLMMLNDAEATTKEDILQFIQKAIDNLN